MSLHLRSYHSRPSFVAAGKVSSCYIISNIHGLSLTSVLCEGKPIDASLAIKHSYRKLTAVSLDILEWLASKEVLQSP